MLMRNLVAPVALPILRLATRSYVTGPEITDAVAVARTAAGRGFAATLCYWNEDLEDPERVAEHYQRVLAAIEVAGLDADLAVKVPALHDRVDLSEAVVARARSTGKRVVFDAHAPETTDATLAMVHRLGPEGLGCAVPGRWLRSEADARLVAGLGAAVRVVKGQWVDPQSPHIDLRDGFMRIVHAVAGRAVHVGVATHDAPLAEKALEVLRDAGTPHELELLFGLPIEPAAAVARRHGVRVRLYVPFGTAWLPYSVSKAVSNPKVLLWLARDLVRRRDRNLKRPPPTE